MNESPLPESSPSLSESDAAMLEALVSSLIEVQRGIAAFQGMQAQLLHAAHELALSRIDLSRADGDLPLREIAAEIAAALRVSDRTVQRQLSEATTLTERFPAIHDALTAGRVTRAHVTVLIEAGDRIDDPARRTAFEEALLPIAERESASRLRGAARRFAEQLLPRSIDERQQDAASTRRVDVRDLDDGLSELFLRAPSTLVHGIGDRLTSLALAVRAGDQGEERTLDQLRADLLCELALTGEVTADDPAGILRRITADVHVSVPVLSLAGASTEPAMLDGVQPIDTATALHLVGASPGWDRVLTHPVTGSVLAVDRYRPSAELRRFLRAIDERCRFPGCMIPARRCDLDHIHDAALGGATARENLADACRRHHVLKHHSAWSVAKSRDGTLTWTSPTGRCYPDRVNPRVMFVPETEPEPDAGSAPGPDSGAPPGPETAPF